MADDSLAADVNLLAKFLANEEVSDLTLHDPVDCIILCTGSVLQGPSTLFRALQSKPFLTKTLVLCGGIGHSSSFIYEAVSKHPTYNELTDDISDLPEARVLQMIMQYYFDVPAIISDGCRVLVEDQSTNCGANAVETRKLLEASGVEMPKTCIIVQDPTMALRTTASFKKVYEDVKDMPRFLCCPVFVPEMVDGKEGLEWANEDVGKEELWPPERFLKLIAGEIPRLRDDGEGYGPRGKGFISHVDIPADVEAAWKRLHEKGWERSV